MILSKLFVLQEISAKTCVIALRVSKMSPNHITLTPVSCPHRNLSTKYKPLGSGEIFLPFVRSTPMSENVALVTGGADDNGLYYVRELLRNGAKAIMIADTDINKGKRVIRDLGMEYGESRTAFIKANPANTLLLKNAFTVTKRHFSKIDIVVNITNELRCDTWEEKIDTNVKGVIRGTLLGIEYMGRHNGGVGGAVVNIITTSSKDDDKECPVLVGAKHYITSFGQAVSRQYYKHTFVKVITLTTTIDGGSREEAPMSEPCNRDNENDRESDGDGVEGIILTLTKLNTIRVKMLSYAV
ncbi:hypothetical protein NQ317_013251 [Molorchus minor]|uniref:Uncharacterized protein n=1 Tax=Molorchus minor TaxID=1323400 RepID=A0ABQ9JXH4_9CUCU|nr:hypothetical protein NQ317_013251 [Molorchus minor]